MNKTTNRWIRSGMAMLLALVMVLGAPVVALANTAAYCNAADATSEVASAENYCSNARKIVDTIVSMLIDGEYADVFAMAVKMNMKSVVVDVIVDELDGKEDLMRKIGMEPTAENKRILADEIYEVAKLYYNTNSKSGRAAADKAAMLEVLRFALVQMRGMSDADAKKTAELYYELNSIKASKGQEAAEAYYLEKFGVKHSIVDGVCTACGYEDPSYVVPEPTEPEVTEPAPTEPEVTEPAPTEPEVTEPAPTEPEVTEPAPTEPEVTEPEVTEPAPTEPKPTEPAPTEPEEDKTPSFSAGSIKDLLENIFGGWGNDEDEDETPAPTEPEVTEPTPTEPAPTEPESNEPGFSTGSLKDILESLFGGFGGNDEEPAPSEPAPTEPAPTEPEEDDSNNGIDLGGFLEMIFGWLR